MSDSQIILKPGAGGRHVDVEDVPVPGSATKVTRSRIQIAGKGEDRAAIAEVTRAAPPPTAWGLAVRAIGGATDTVLSAVKDAIDALAIDLAARLGPLGQAAMAGSAPVVIASDQSALPVTLNASNSSAGDAFGRIRTAHPQAIFEATHQYDLAPSLMGTLLSGAGSGGTVALASPHAILTTTATAGRIVRHRSHRYMLYQPGKSQLVRITGQLGDGTALTWMGYGDESDGVFLERDDTGTYIRLRSSTIGDQRIAQSSWNVDPMDGTGPSGLAFDPSMAQHLVIDLQWLAVGSLRVGLSIDRRIQYVHFFDFANRAIGAYMRTGSLPIEWGIESLGTATSMKAICASVSSEGGHDPYGQIFSASCTTAKTLLDVGVRTPLIALQPALSYGGQTNRGHIVPAEFLALVDSTNDRVLLEVVVNPTVLTGAAFSAVGDTSHAEIDQSATAITGGVAVWSDYAISNAHASLADQQLRFRSIPLVVHANGTDRDVAVLCATRLGNSVKLFGGFNWVEIR